MKTRYKIIIIVGIIAVAIPGIMIFGAVPLMIASNAYSGFIMSSTSDESFEEDFAKIPEVKFFIEKYPNYTTNHSSDFLGWKIINYDANVSNSAIHLSIKKSVLHQGVKVSAGCEIYSPSSYALSILDDKVMDYLKNDLCFEENNDLNNIPDQIKTIFDLCDCKERGKMNPDGNTRCDEPFVNWQNSTHYIDNNICEWQKIK